MQNAESHISDRMSLEDVSLMTLPDLKSLVERYPYFHLARLTLLRMLYQQRDPEFNDELRRSALYLPSRETIFEFVEGDKMRPRPEEHSSAFYGATQAHKANERLSSPTEEHDRTESLIDSFLNQGGAPTTPVPQRRGRADARVDYISYMLAEEEETRREASLSASTPVVVDDKPVDTVPVDKPEQAEVDKEGLIDNFIQSQGDRRIRLHDKKDSELQKPVIDVDNSPTQGAFTETLARIYIKQGKFEQAIEIIRRLSLKYPKKNRYFADQIRFLEKLIANQKALKG